MRPVCVLREHALFYFDSFLFFVSSPFFLGWLPGEDQGGFFRHVRI